ncbi:MAG: enhanced serine sensitivity protein SseB C-terminal domain-containing protein [Mycobacteriales bacterium]
MNPAETALVEARGRGRVDDELLQALADQPLTLGLDVADGSPRPAARELDGQPPVLAWTSPQRAVDAGWTGPVVERPGHEIASLLAGTGLGLALNPGEPVGVRLDPDGLAQLALAGPVPAGTAVYLGAPAVPDEQLETRLCDEVGAVDGVAAVRLVTMVVGDAEPRATVVLSLQAHAHPAVADLARQACWRAAAMCGRDELDIVLDDQLGGLRASVLQLPAL